MADFHAQGLDRKVDHLMDLLFGAGVNSHATIIEQINYLLFLRALSIRDQALIDLGIEDKNQIVFDGDLAQYRWENLLMLNPDSLFIALEKCYLKISESTTNKTVRLLFRDAHLKIYDKPTLRRLIHEIDKFAKELDLISDKGQKDIFGDMYEYLLSKLNQSGTAGQFRTPRHIIEFIVKVLDPERGETILDPAVGTAGFLVKAYEHLAHKYTSERYLEEGSYSFDKLNAEEKMFLYNHTFSGFDSDSDMIKFGMMNLFLHGLENARLIRQNTLADTTGNREKWDVILANPPFAGKIDRESVSEDLQMGTGSTEILFLRYMIDHLSENGRVGVIVPEGVIFSNTTAHKKIRQMLIDKGLWCVVSLPAGVFNPYAGVKTSVLFVDKTLAKKAREVLFVTIDNDGFETGATKRPTQGDQLPQAIKDINEYKDFIVSGNTHSNNFLERIERDRELGDTLITRHDRLLLVAKSEIEKKDYSLSSGTYRIEEIFKDQKWPMIKIGSLTIKLLDGDWIESKDQSDSGIRLIQTGNIGIGEFLDKKNRARYISEATFNRLNCTEIFPEDVLISRLPDPVGRACLVPILRERMITAVDCAILRFDMQKVIPKYFIYIASSKQYFNEIEHLLTGASRQRISRTNLSNIEIPLPPIEIQERIVEELDSYQKIIDGAKQIIDNWKPKIDIDPEWEKVKVGDICKIERGASPRPIDKFTTDDPNGFNWVKIGDTKNSDKYITKTAEKVTKEGAERSRKVFLGDFILSNSMSFGRPYIMKIEGYIHDGWLRLSEDESKISKDFLYYILSSNIVAEQFENAATGGVVRNLNSELVRNVKIPLPPIDAQKQIVEKIETERELVESAKKIIEIYEHKIKDKIAEAWGENKKENV